MSHHRGKTASKAKYNNLPFSPSPIISRINSVRTTPGCSEVTSPRLPTFSANAAVKSTLQSFDLEQATLGSQLVSKSMFCQSGLGSGPNPISFLWAREETLVMRKKGAAVSFFQRRKVRQKWPRWLTPHCISKPSLVVLRCGMAITPALLTRQSMCGKETADANASMELRLARSSGMYSTFADGYYLSTPFTTSSAVSRFLAPMITWHPSPHNTFTVSAPIPEFPPVTTAYLPVRSILGIVYCPPRRQSLRRASRGTVRRSSCCRVRPPQSGVASRLKSCYI